MNLTDKDREDLVEFRRNTETMLDSAVRIEDMLVHLAERGDDRVDFREAATEARARLQDMLIEVDFLLSEESR